MATLPSTLITRVRLENYKSIASCDVTLGPLTYLVGPNGAGKSNFLDALRFVSDALTSTFDLAQHEHDGFRRDAPRHFSIDIDFALPTGKTGHYRVRVEGASFTESFVKDEECVVQAIDQSEPPDRYLVAVYEALRRIAIYNFSLDTVVFEQLYGRTGHSLPFLASKMFSLEESQAIWIHRSILTSRRQ